VQRVLGELLRCTGIRQDILLCMDFVIHSADGLGITRGELVPNDCAGPSRGNEVCFVVGN